LPTIFGPKGRSARAAGGNSCMIWSIGWAKRRPKAYLDAFAA
jgi:hypothetical protein